MGELDGKVALITGAGSGMGRAASRVFIREGARVLGVDISGREQEAAEELGGAFVPFHGDVSIEDDVEAMFAGATERFDRIDAVLNVAGVTDMRERVADITLETFERMIAVNLRGVMLGTKHAIRAMAPTGGGTILNWSSIVALNASHVRTHAYAMAKAGVISITKAAAVECGPQGIRANAICPGIIVTEMLGGRDVLDRYPQLVESTALKRAGEPEEVAELACFLASDRAPFITGAVITIDGGQSATLV